MATKTGSGPAASPNPDEQFVDECARPGCRGEFRRAVTAGRPQEYCNEFCRRQAEKELRRLKAKLSRYEALAAQTHTDIAAHGRAHERDDAQVAMGDEQRTAQDAVIKAEGILEVGTDEDAPYFRQLRSLFDAVAPFVTAAREHARSA
jgi:hypothetical protein